MKPSSHFDKIGVTTTKSLEKNTGLSWDQWISQLNKAGAANWKYQQITTYLKKKKIGIWWVHIVAGGYEVAMGRRLPGQSLKGTYSVIVTKTIPISKAKAWKWLTSDSAIQVWLKPLSPIEIKKGQVFETPDGVYGEIRTFKKNQRIRLAWNESDGEKKSVLQVLLFGRDEKKCGIAFQHEQLKDGRKRNWAREHWKNVVAELLVQLKN